MIVPFSFLAQIDPLDLASTHTSLYMTTHLGIDQYRNPSNSFRLPTGAFFTHHFASLSA